LQLGVAKAAATSLWFFSLVAFNYLAAGAGGQIQIDDAT
jgi:hypothetical protein